jgi:rhamnogalacturonyl hydrolase YesR
MRKAFLILVLLGLLLSITFSTYAQSPDYTSPDQILKILHKTNDYQYDNPWTEDDDYNWIRGTYYTGVMAAYQATGDKKFLDQCNKWGEDHDWGLPPIEQGARPSGVNVLTCTQTWLESYLIKKDKAKLQPVIAHFDAANSKNPLNQPITWYWEGGRRYVDALYVGPPAMVMLSNITKEDKYINWMESFFWDVFGKLYDYEDSLFYRDRNFIPGFSGKVSAYHIRPDSIKREDAMRSYVYQPSPNGKKVLWSRGNGWALAGIARILKYLPREHGNYDKYMAVYKEMAWSLKHRQRDSGYWPMNLADPDDYPYPETSGTAFFTYALTMGINEGWLPSDAFLPVVKKAWQALCDSVSEGGKVQWGQPVGYSPYKISKEDSHEYVTGMFLLAGSEMYKMYSK